MVCDQGEVYTLEIVLVILPRLCATQAELYKAKFVLLNVATPGVF